MISDIRLAQNIENPFLALVYSPTEVNLFMKPKTRSMSSDFLNIKLISPAFSLVESCEISDVQTFNIQKWPFHIVQLNISKRLRFIF